MFLWYILSVIAGVVLGAVYAVVFYKGNSCFSGQQVPGNKPSTRAFGLFFLRYLLLFAAFWILFYMWRLNIYCGIAGFFVAYWGVLLNVVYTKKDKESR